MTESGSHRAVDLSDWHALAKKMIDAMCDSDRQRMPRTIGVSGSQGSGKSTLARVVVEHLQRRGFTAAAVSLDDFYLTHADRQTLGATVHPLLCTRGVPGTHDTGWLQRVMAAMQEPAEQAATVKLPVFDKGMDDRSGQRESVAQVLVLEGWCLGVRAQPEIMLQDPINRLEREEDPQGVWRRWVNEQIRQHYEPLWRQIDYWVQLKPPGFEQVVMWRGQQEQQIEPTLRMDAIALGRFIDHYERLTRWQWASSPPQPGLFVHLAPDHSVQSVEALAEKR
jgi:D-glycerate 3-kinase